MFGQDIFLRPFKEIQVEFILGQGVLDVLDHPIHILGLQVKWGQILDRIPHCGNEGIRLVEDGCILDLESPGQIIGCAYQGCCKSPGLALECDSDVHRICPILSPVARNDDCLECDHCIKIQTKLNFQTNIRQKFRLSMADYQPTLKYHPQQDGLKSCPGTAPIGNR